MIGAPYHCISRQVNTGTDENKKDGGGLHVHPGNPNGTGLSHILIYSRHTDLAHSMVEA